MEKYLDTRTFAIAFVIRQKKKSVTTYMFYRKGLRKLWHIQVMKYYACTKKLKHVSEEHS